MLYKPQFWANRFIAITWFRIIRKSLNTFLFPICSQYGQITPLLRMAMKPGQNRLLFNANSFIYQSTLFFFLCFSLFSSSSLSINT